MARPLQKKLFLWLPCETAFFLLIFKYGFCRHCNLKYLKHIKLNISPETCAPLSELPSDMNNIYCKLFLGVKLLYERVCSRVHIIYNHFLLVTSSLTFVFVFIYISKELFCVKKNYMLNMCTFHAFSVCHSLSQSVSAVTLFTFGS